MVQGFMQKTPFHATASLLRSPKSIIINNLYFRRATALYVHAHNNQMPQNTGIKKHAEELRYSAIHKQIKRTETLASSSSSCCSKPKTHLYIRGRKKIKALHRSAVAKKKSRLRLRHHGRYVQKHKETSPLSLSHTHAQTAFLFFSQTHSHILVTQLLPNQNFNAPMLSDNFSPFTAFAG
jgi:hypothetical protein